jgi:hypothetical protein
MNGSRYVSGSPYTRALVWNPNATNDDLVAMVTAATRAAWRCIDVPAFMDRESAPLYAHRFARDAVSYVLEDGDQLVRMPWRSVADGVGDCKSLAVLTASLCRAAGCSVVLRFVGYPGDDHFAHVYTVADGVVVDPELTYGAEVDHAFRRDVRV